jgi:hypothetical protein
MVTIDVRPMEHEKTNPARFVQTKSIFFGRNRECYTLRTKDGEVKEACYTGGGGDLTNAHLDGYEVSTTKPKGWFGSHTQVESGDRVKQQFDLMKNAYELQEKKN